MKEEHRLKVYQEALKSFWLNPTHCLCYALFSSAKRLGLLSGDHVDAYAEEIFPDFYALKPDGIREGRQWYGDPEEKANQQKRIGVLQRLIKQLKG